MLDRLATLNLEPGVDVFEIGLMAAASPQFAEGYAYRPVELLRASAEQAAPTRHWVDAAPVENQASSR